MIEGSKWIETSIKTNIMQGGVEKLMLTRPTIMSTFYFWRHAHLILCLISEILCKTSVRSRCFAYCVDVFSYVYVLVFWNFESLIRFYKLFYKRQLSTTRSLTSFLHTMVEIYAFKKSFVMKWLPVSFFKWTHCWSNNYFESSLEIMTLFVP